MTDPSIKKIAVLIRDRQAEALRMALGLTLADDAVDVYVMGDSLEDNDADDQTLELLEEMDVGLYANREGLQSLEFVPTDDIADRLVQYDHILPY